MIRTPAGECRECRKLLKPAVAVETAATSDGTPRPNHRRRGVAKSMFCSIPCKAAWHNRAKLRGADALHLLMNCRLNRKAAVEGDIWTLLCRMVTGWNVEDEMANDGRGRETFFRLNEIMPRLFDKGALPRGVQVQRGKKRTKWDNIRFTSKTDPTF